MTPWDPCPAVHKLDMVAHTTYNPRGMPEVEAGRSGVKGHLCSKVRWKPALVTRQTVSKTANASDVGSPSVYLLLLLANDKETVLNL